MNKQIHEQIKKISQQLQTKQKKNFEQFVEQTIRKNFQKKIKFSKNFNNKIFRQGRASRFALNKILSKWRVFLTFCIYKFVT